MSVFLITGIVLAASGELLNEGIFVIEESFEVLVPLFVPRLL